MECRRFRDIADSYLSEELLVETNHEVLRHLESCPDCRAELAARRQVRRTLRLAFGHAAELQPAEDLSDRVQRFVEARVAEQRPVTRRGRVLRWARGRLWMGHGVSLDGGVSLNGGSSLSGGSSLNGGSSLGGGSSLNGGGSLDRGVGAPIEGRPGQAEIDAAPGFAGRLWAGRRWAVATVLLLVAGAGGAMVSQAWWPFSEDLIAARSPTGTPTGRALMEVAPFAAGDHRECALEGRPESRVALDEASRRFDPVYAGLADAIRRRERSSTKRTNIVAEVVDGHSCVFQGRRFGHVMFKHAGRLVSVLVTDFSVAQKSTGLARLTGRDGSRRVAPCSQNADFRVACFPAPHHAVFVVSDLGELDNLALARSVAPVLQQHLTAVSDKHASYGTSGLGDLWNYSEHTRPDEVVPSTVVVRPVGP